MNLALELEPWRPLRRLIGLLGIILGLLAFCYGGKLDTTWHETHGHGYALAFLIASGSLWGCTWVLMLCNALSDMHVTPGFNEQWLTLAFLGIFCIAKAVESVVLQGFPFTTPAGQILGLAMVGTALTCASELRYGTPCNCPQDT